MSDEEVTVNLLAIYNKADIDNISDKELKELIKNLRQINKSTITKKTGYSRAWYF